METHRIYRLMLDLSDDERRRLAQAAAQSGERFVDFVRRRALEGASTRVPQERLVTRLRA